MPAMCACVMLVWAGPQRMGHVHAWDGLRNVTARCDSGARKLTMSMDGINDQIVPRDFKVIRAYANPAPRRQQLATLPAPGEDR